MKRIFIAIIFISFAVIMGAYSTIKTDRLCNDITQKIEIMTKENTDILKENNHDKRIDFYKSTVKLNEFWEENSDFFYFFFNNDEIKAIETNIEKLPQHAKNGDLESAYLCLVEALEEFEYLKNNSALNFDNIF